MGAWTRPIFSRRFGWAVVTLGWSGLVIGGFHQAMAWDFTPGQPAVRPPLVAASSARPLLIVTVNSQCPCSLATMNNLVALESEIPNRLVYRIVLTGPNARESSTYSFAAKIPDAQVKFMTEQQVLASYGARTSGQAFLYSASGRLVFAGGLTDGRGVVGDSNGIEAVRSIIAGRVSINTAPVYGCPLQTPRPNFSVRSRS